MEKMLFVIDIGNTNIVAAFMQSASNVVYEDRTATVKTDTTEDIKKEFIRIFERHGIKPEDIFGAVVSSVVPEITQEAAKAAEEIIGKKTLVLTDKIDSGIEICTEEPSKTGADLIAAAAGAACEYDGNIAIFDLGTATTLTVVTDDRRFIGGLIMPGVKISLEAMTSRASQLHDFPIEAPDRFIGKNTVESMQSGVVYGNAAMMDALTERIEDDLGCEVTTLVTGGLGVLIYPYCKRRMIYERDLVLKGLWYIYEKNSQIET